MSLAQHNTMRDRVGRLKLVCLTLLSSKPFCLSSSRELQKVSDLVIVFDMFEASEK